MAENRSALPASAGREPTAAAGEDAPPVAASATPVESAKLSHAAVTAWQTWAVTIASRPLVLLGALATASTGLRCFRLDKPSGLMGDEIFYVNAARDILGHHAGPAGLPSLGAGIDSNPIHPPLAKLLIAGSIRLFGDNPVAWRLPSLLFGTAAILLIYLLVRSAGGRSSLALTAAAIMSVDNLFFVHGRMATLDIFVMTLMLAAVALHLRGRWGLAGVAAGLAAATKLVGADAVLVIVLIEVGRIWIRSRERLPDERSRRRSQLAALSGFAAAGAITFLAVLGVMDHFVGVEKNPIVHTENMVRDLSIPNTTITSTGRPVSPHSSPDQWFVDQVAIPYWVYPPALDFLGVISPLVIYAALPVLALAALRVIRDGDDVSLLALAWVAGTLAPFVYGDMIHRTSYLYYMLIVLPGIYVAIARCFFPRPRMPDTVRVLYVVGLAYNFVALFPVRSWSGG